MCFLKIRVEVLAPNVTVFGDGTFKEMEPLKREQRWNEVRGVGPKADRTTALIRPGRASR